MARDVGPSPAASVPTGHTRCSGLPANRPQQPCRVMTSMLILVVDFGR